MGINFSSMETTGATTVGTPIVTGVAEEISTPQGMTLDLGKSTVLDLSKKEKGMKHVTLAAGWDVSQVGADFDLDISAFLLNENGKLESVGDIVYFNKLELPGIKLNGDNQTGEGEGDDETIDINLAKIPSKFSAIVFAVNIYDAMARKQTFGMVNNAYVRLLNKDENNKEVCRFVLKDDYSSSTGVIFAKLKRENDDWKLETIGEGKVVENLNDFIKVFS